MTPGFRVKLDKSVVQLPPVLWSGRYLVRANMLDDIYNNRFRYPWERKPTLPPYRFTKNLCVTSRFDV